MASSKDEPAELDGYVEDSGPGFDPAEQVTSEFPAVDQAAAAAGGMPDMPAELWEESTIREVLSGFGEGLHLFAGVGETDWKMTEADLEQIAPPLTRIANRYEPVARLAPYADPFLVAKGFAIYGWRSVLARKAALAAREQQFEGYAVDHGPPPEEQSPAAEPAQNGGVTLFADRARQAQRQTGDQQ